MPHLTSAQIVLLEHMVKTNGLKSVLTVHKVTQLNKEEASAEMIASVSPAHSFRLFADYLPDKVITGKLPYRKVGSEVHLSCVVYV